MPTKEIHTQVKTKSPVYTLRDYQVRVMEDVKKYLQKTDVKPTVVVAPTGSGKAILIANTAREARLVGGKVIVLQPSKELLEQNYEKYTSYGYSASVYSASLGQKEIGDVTFATLGSVKMLGNYFKKEGFTTLLVDECDNSYPPERGSMFRTFLDTLRPSHTIGFTASPFRLKSYGQAFKNWCQLNMLNFGRIKVFDSFLNVVQIEEMVRGGYWAELDYELWDFDDHTLKLNSTGAEFSETSVRIALDEQHVNTNILNRCKKLIEEGKSALVFMDTVDNAVRTAKMLGVKAGCIHAKTSDKERASLISAFRKGDIKILTNQAVLTCGFDYPALDAVILGRPTNSLALYYQMTGRVVRNPMYPKGRKKGLLIDFCNNTKRFGKIEDLRIEEIDGYGWGVFNGDYILTGVPMGTRITKQEIIEQCNNPIEVGDDPDMKFGKHKGLRISELPVEYRIWLLQEIDVLHHPSLTSEVKKKMKVKLLQLTSNPDTAFTSDLNSIEKRVVFDPRSILLLDFNNIAHILHSKKKLNMEGLSEYILSLCQNYRTSNFKILVDTKPYWRSEIFDEYKANRKVMTLDKKFLELRSDLLEIVLGRPECVFKTGFEADDFVGAYARNLEFDRVIVVSADGDFKQLFFYKRFVQYNPLLRKESKYTKQDAVHCLIDKVLKGDTKDNIGKSHYETRITSGVLNEVVEQVCTDIFDFVSKNKPKNANDIPFRTLIWNRLNATYKMKKSVFDRNFTLINLLQDEFTTRNNHSYTPKYS